MNRRPVESHEAFVGLLCVWEHTPRGGYGYVCPVDAKIVALNLQGDEATISVSRRDGRQVKRRVKTSALRHRA